LRSDAPLVARHTRASPIGIARGYRRLAIRMGGVMIKVGQFLSSRLDVLPQEIVAELAGLQDEVPAEEIAAIRELAEAELGPAGELRVLRDPAGCLARAVIVRRCGRPGPALPRTKRESW
jgi:predicted unusual protein kinase regulating ubiquinone biosynthesis (AarF/ABC1/UbiB family)